MNSQPFFRASANDPSLDWSVTPDQHARAESYLQNAYAEGRINGEEFEDRISLALQATTRRELNEAFTGLANIGPGSSAIARTGYLSDTIVPVTRNQGTTAGAIAHFSSAPTWLFGPGLIALGTQKGTPAHREAAKAFNATVSATIVIVILSMLSFIPFMNRVTGIAFVLWVVFAVIGGVMANRGKDWTNPYSRLLPLKVLDEGPKPR